MRATVTVKSFEVTGGSGVLSRVRGGRLSGFFFNTGSGTGGGNSGDILAAIYIEGLSDSPHILRVVAHVEKCSDRDASCNLSEVIFLGDFGTVRIGKPTRLSIQWDEENHQFIFQRDHAQKVYDYTGDVNPSTNPAKRIDVSNRAVGNGADLLVGSTHKTFPGPQGGIILCKNDIAEAVDEAVFPGVVSNHHLHHLAALGIATAEMLEFGADYADQTIKNAQKLGESLYELGFNVLCEDQGFTKSHQVVMDVSNINHASTLAKTLENNNIILNKNLLPWDDVNRTDDPSGIRMGTQEITRRGMKESEMAEVAEYIKNVVMDGKTAGD